MNLIDGRLDVEVIAARRSIGVPPAEQIERLCVAAARSLGCRDGHVAIEFVDERRIAELNERHRGLSRPTDVLSFPIDGLDEQRGAQRELGDVVICPQQTDDIEEAVVHGVLHLLGMDHETDGGEMLALQARILEEGRRR
jgi:probable rRNA maturation factor